ncbi:uncharacterized protein LOC125370088 [Ricinus communis]|uniref:SHSP domain-containing protein n=1 Tax=Ricinus communis TaxID=3988 RepID=B9SSG5_RICCO|nr:uncharacterized protein LOC125370088 [Ricinus communis]EEF33463.1 hypothetical protein RCOM_1061400 [Ricinus communis]
MGSREAFESKTTANGELFLRVDMPGVEAKDVKVVAKGWEVRFFDKARKRGHDLDGPEYMGSVSLLPMTILKRKVEHEVKDGVLRMVVPPA